MIKCRKLSNIKCLRCNIVQLKMVRIGALFMCPSCFAEEFGAETTEFDPESVLGTHYYTWVNKWKELVWRA